MERDKVLAICVLSVFITCLVTAVLYENTIDNLQEECRLDHIYYEEKIERYKYEVEIMSQENELTTDVLNVECYSACLGGCIIMQVFHNLTKNESIRVPISSTDYELCRYFCWREHLPNLPYTMRYV